MLTRDAILGAPAKLPREEVPVPEWGGSVWVRTLTGAERDRLEVDWEVTKRQNFRARLVFVATCDEQGKPLFQPGDIAALGQQSSAALSRICDVAFRLNAFTRQDVEELKKTSETDPCDDSPSGMRRVLVAP